jgi:hypothetical protein
MEKSRSKKPNTYIDWTFGVLKSNSNYWITQNVQLTNANRKIEVRISGFILVNLLISQKWQISKFLSRINHKIVTICHKK